MKLPEPEAPVPPPGGESVWELWLEIAEGRGATGFGEQMLSWSDLAAWAQLSGITPSPSEARLILVMDRSYLAALHDEREKHRPKTKK